MSPLSPEDFELSGPALLRKAFFPRQCLTITDLSKVLGLSRDRIYKRFHKGQLNLRIRRDDSGRPLVVLDDLIAYLYPPQTDPNPEPIKRKPGRPRKTVTSDGQEGGA